ncbi:MAG TPA: hypothetical protein DCG32_01390 [Sphaerochaeta sp.]|jgi:hypothetical protein|nr:hypothetical protein [Sphaerochaeta sp.]
MSQKVREQLNLVHMVVIADKGLPIEVIPREPLHKEGQKLKMKETGNPLCRSPDSEQIYSQ